MPREISDEEYNFLQGKRQIADFVESIYNDPQLGREAKSLIKRKYPQVNIPDYDIEERMNQRFDEERKRYDEAERARLEEQQQKEFTATRSKVQKDYGFTNEGMAELEKFMVERNIGDYEVAASYRAAKEPKQMEADHGDGFWHHTQKEGFAEIAKDPEGWARTEILGALRRDAENARGGR